MKEVEEDQCERDRWVDEVDVEREEEERIKERKRSREYQVDGGNKKQRQMVGPRCDAQ
jgi:hypothetical protein